MGKSDMQPKKESDKPKIIFMIPYAHCDNAWAHTRRWHEDRYTLIINEVLDIMQRDPDYKWFLDTAFEELSPFARRCPERMPELRKRAQEGRIEVAPTVISNPTAESIGSETFVRNMVYGRRYFERVLGATSQVHTCIDLMPGHSQIPQLISKGGYKYHRFTRPLRTDLVDFYWEGLDGTVVLASRGHYGYGAMADARAFPHDYETNWDEAAEVIYEEARNYVRRVYEKGELVSKQPVPGMSRLGDAGVVWFPRGADDCRPLRDFAGRPVDILGLVREWGRRESVPMQFGTPTEYFHELEKHRSMLPVISGVLGSSSGALRCAFGDDSLVLWWLRNEIAVTTAERFSCLASVCFGKRYPEETIDKLWQDLFTTTGHAIHDAFTNDYDRLLGKVKRVEKRARSIADSARALLASKIRHAQPGRPVVVFNAHAWDRRDLAAAELTFERGEAVGMVLRDGENRVVPYQITGRELHADGTVKRMAFAFIAEVPSLGYTTYYAEAAQSPGVMAKTAEYGQTAVSEEGAEGRRLEIGSAFFDVIFDRGHLTSVRLKQNGKEILVTKNSAVNAVSWSTLEPNDSFFTGGPFLEEIDETDVELVRAERGPVYSKVVTRGRIASHRIRKETVVYSELPRIDCSVAIHAKGGDGVFKAKFPFGFEGKMMVHIPFGTEERDRPKEPFSIDDFNVNYPQTFSAEQWIDYSCRDFGVAICSQPGQRGFEFDPEGNVAKHILLKNRTMPKRKLPTADGRIFDWRHLNRYHEAKGLHTLRYSLYPHEGGWQEAQVHRRAVEFQEPLTCTTAKTGRKPLLPQEHSFVQVSPESIVMTGFYMDGERVVVRVYESHGKPARAKIGLPFAIEEAAETDFYGDPMKPGKKIEVEEGGLIFDAKPWEIVTLFVRPGQAGCH